MRYAYFPGCSLHSTAREYDVSLRAVCGKLGVEITEIENWICCGSSAIHAAPKRLAMALPLKNLAEAEHQGLTEVMAPCAACFARFKFAQHEVKQHPELRPELEGIIGRAFSNSIQVLHPLEIFGDGLLGTISQLARNALAGLKIVCYYGCLLTRPPQVTHFDDVENPQSMDRLMSALGASVLDWGYKTDCCGGSFALTKTEIVLRLSREILEGAKAAGAQAIAVACPLCQVNLDSRQAEIEKAYGTPFKLPIYYFTQLMGVALGVPKTELMLESHFVDAQTMLEKVAVP
jgi:heterodisulfide reductase subunit B